MRFPCVRDTVPYHGLYNPQIQHKPNHILNNKISTLPIKDRKSIWDFTSERSNAKFQVSWDYGAETWSRYAKHIVSRPPSVAPEGRFRVFSSKKFPLPSGQNVGETAREPVSSHSPCPRVFARSVLTGRRLRHSTCWGRACPSSRSQQVTTLPRSDATRRGRRGYSARRARLERCRTPRAEAARVLRRRARLERFRTPRAEGGAGISRAGPSSQLPPRLRGDSTRQTPQPGMAVKGRRFAPVNLRAVVQSRNGRSGGPGRSRGGRRGRSSSRRPPPGP